MIPANRLIFWTAVLVPPFAALSGVLPNWAPLGLTVIGVFVILVLLDLTLSLGCLETVSVDLPEVVRMSKGRSADIPMTFRHPETRMKKVVLGLNLPREFASDKEVTSVRFKKQEETLIANWQCRPLARGRYALAGYGLETPSRLGFWAIRSRRPLTCEIRVYPDLLSDRNRLSALFLNRGILGVHAQRQVGQGREFEKLREYIPGDSIDQIHWKATAKRNIPMSKMFQIERTQEVYVMVDTSRLSGRRHADTAGLQETGLEHFLKAALVTGLAAQQQGDLFGLLAFSNRVHSFVRAKGGKHHFNTCRDQLFMLETDAVTPDFRELGTFIRQRLKKRALIIILTSLDDPLLAEEFATAMELINRQHLIMVISIRAPFVRPLFQDSNVRSVDDIIRHMAGHLQFQNLRELEKTLRRHGVNFMQADHENLALDMVTQYMNVKRRQLL